MRWKSRLIRIGWLVILMWSIRIASAQVIWISGGLVDYHTNQPIAASWQWVDSTEHTLVKTTASASGFQGYVSAQVRLLRVDAAGYRPIRLPIHWNQSPTDSMRFRVMLPAVPVDKPTADQPYFQSEQKPLQLIEKTSIRRSVPANIYILDALTNQPVWAEVSLFFTHDHQKITYPVSKSVRTKLLSPDIVALEIRAAGYQTYLGNLVVNHSPADDVFSYEIRLNPMPTLLMTSALRGDTDDIMLKTIGTGKQSLAINTRTNWAIKPGKYQIRGGLQKVIDQGDTIDLKAGINTYEFDRKSSPVNRNTPQCDVLYFAQSSYEISTTARNQLDELITKMLREPDRTIQIIGHTDSVGNPELNLTLSEFRAKATRAYLIQRGIRPERIDVDAAGDQRPAFPNDSESSRSRNRRVDLCLN
ncbi:OmpA family protein [Spirosoma validum]|uniref:OmpA family protein n=1 Tax=Spirosoma validum TaxID=2771355 RepID=A0A927GBW9_9BACT|nr:OmpA family protein [Spirosoma validum]MBD2751841.1 OmpA family protein [Spirosoma validum]